MIARGRVVGALGLVRLAGSPPFDEIDTLVATDIAHRAAAAVDNARLYRAQADISSRLQQALLPTLPKQLPVRAAVRYLPARSRFDVGGDWYDLFRSRANGESTVLVIGDVAGHDLQAGTTMSALRNLLRGNRRRDRRAAAPGARVGRRQHALARDRGHGDRLADDGDAATGRHVAPRLEQRRAHAAVAAVPGRRVEMLNELHGTLLGTDIAQARTQAERVVAAGSTLVLYTDGLVETREATIDAGLTHLRRTAMSLSAPIDDPAAVAVELLARNHASSEDDTAMLVCHLPELRS